MLGQALVSARVFALASESGVGERGVLVMFAAIIRMWGDAAPRVVRELTAEHIGALVVLLLRGADYHELRSFTVAFLGEAAGDLAQLRDEYFELYGGGGPADPASELPS